MKTYLLDKNFLKQLDAENQREVYAKIVSLNIHEEPIESIEGRVTGGSISIDGSSSVRRSCNLTLVSQQVNINDIYWGFSNKFKLYIGVLNTIKACLPIFREQNHGKIIAISSVAAVAPIPFQGFYSASKSAIMLLMQSLSMEVKPYNIKCTCILPGDVKTDFTSSRKYTEASTLPSSEYTNAMKAAVQTMEKDEQNGMMPIVIAKAIAKVLKKENPKPVVVPHITYKLLYLLIKLVPTRLKIWVISKMYS